jgi:hypothetical protein
MNRNFSHFKQAGFWKCDEARTGDQFTVLLCNQAGLQQDFEQNPKRL